MHILAEATLDKHGMLLALFQELGIPGSIATEDACAIDHSISPETYAALKQLLNDTNLMKRSVRAGEKVSAS